MKFTILITILLLAFTQGQEQVTTTTQNNSYFDTTPAVSNDTVVVTSQTISTEPVAETSSNSFIVTSPTISTESVVETSSDSFIELSVLSLYPDSPVIVPIDSTTNLEIYLESFESSKFATYFGYTSQVVKREEEMICNVSDVCYTKIPNLDASRQYYLKIESFSESPQHILFNFDNYTIFENETKTFTLGYDEKYLYTIPNNVTFVTVAITSANNNSRFSSYLIESHQFFSKQTDDILNGTCYNVTSCNQSDIQLDSQFSYILVIQNESPFSEEVDNFNYNIAYGIELSTSSSSEDSHATIIILSVILGLVFLLVILVLLAIIVLKVYQKRRSNFAVV
jgi:hypothetical protein